MNKKMISISVMSGKVIDYVYVIMYHHILLTLMCIAFDENTPSSALITYAEHQLHPIKTTPLFRVALYSYQ